MADPVQLPEGTVIAEGLGGSIMIGVYYPYRKSPDIYMALNGDCLIGCLQCKARLYRGQETLISHIRRHDRRKRVQKLGAS